MRVLLQMWRPHRGQQLVSGCTAGLNRCSGSRVTGSLSAASCLQCVTGQMDGVCPAAERRRPNQMSSDSVSPESAAADPGS